MNVIEGSGEFGLLKEQGEDEMKSILQRVMLFGMATVALYLLLNPTNGVVYQGPLAVLGTALIGLGFCREAAQRGAVVPCRVVRR